MAIPIIKNWKKYFHNPDEGLGSSYERIILNIKLEQICKNFNITSVLEAPAFGFTGLSGINSLQLAKKGCKITLIDHDSLRLEKINKLWLKLNFELNSRYLSEYNNLPFKDNEFDMSWNFSALWFVENLEIFLTQLTKVTNKVIFICVPNTTGIGYLTQKYFGKKELEEDINEEYIKPKYFTKILNNLGWILLRDDFIDCPPWPDIGMPKEKFLNKFGIKMNSNNNSEPLSIIDYYNDQKPDFADNMLKYYWFEQNVPNIIKKFWAHHHYYIFVPNK